MKTNYLIDNFRTSILNDEIKFKILALLYRDGSQTEDDLSKALNLKLDQIDSKINDLYRAGLIKTYKENIWYLSDFADQILLKLGISLIAAISILSKFEIPKIDKEFLTGCLQTQAEINSDSIKFFTSLLRNYKNVEDTFNKEISKINRTRILYSIIVGMSSESQRLGGESYSSMIFNWHQNRETEWWENSGLKLIGRRDILSRQCVQCNIISGLSDTVLMHGEKQIKKYKTDTYGLTLTRVLSAVLDLAPDEGFLTASKFNQNLPNVVWHNLENYFPNLESKFKVILVNPRLKSLSTVWNKEDSEQLSFKNLFYNVLSIVKPKTHPMLHGNTPELKIWSIIINSDFQWPNYDKLTKDSDLIIAQLNRLDKDLDAGRYCSFSSDEIIKICDTLSRIENKFRNTLIFNDQLLTQKST